MLTKITLIIKIQYQNIIINIIKYINKLIQNYIKNQLDLALGVL